MRAGRTAKRDTIWTTPTLRILLLLRATIPHVECLLKAVLRLTRKWRGVFSSNPPLWLFPVLSTGALSEWLLLMLSPPSSSVSPFCSSLWPSWFLAAFHFFFFFTFLPPFLPSPLHSALAGKQNCTAVRIRVALTRLRAAPILSLQTTDVIHAGIHGIVYYKKGWVKCMCAGLLQQITQFWGRES